MVYKYHGGVISTVVRDVISIPGMAKSTAEVLLSGTEWCILSIYCTEWCISVTGVVASYSEVVSTVYGMDCCISVTGPVASFSGLVSTVRNGVNVSQKNYK